MSFGTIVYNNEIFNLDFMTADEVNQLLKEKIDKNLFAMLNRIYVYKVSNELINCKINNQINSIKFSINQINPNFNEQSKNYVKFQKNLNETMDKYENVLKIICNEYDEKIEKLILKGAKIEAKFATKKDNLEEKEKKKYKIIIKKINVEISKINEEKRKKIFETMEVGGKTLSLDIRKPKKFMKITKFFSNRLNTYNVITKKILLPIMQKIEELDIAMEKFEKIKEFNFSEFKSKINIITEQN